MAAFIAKHKQSTIFVRAARFAVVGALGTLIDFFLYSTGTMFLHLPALIANTISYSAGIGNNYYFHRTWTFEQKQAASGKLFLKFLLVSLTALMLNNGVVLFITPALAGRFVDAPQAAVLAKMLAIGIGICWNFIANHAWTFRS